MSYSFEDFLKDSISLVEALLSSEALPSHLNSCELTTVSDQDPSYDV